MARNGYHPRGAGRNRKVVRNIIIICACLVVFVMFLERGILSSDPSSPIPSSPSDSNAHPNHNNNHKTQPIDQSILEPPPLMPNDNTVNNINFNNNNKNNNKGNNGNLPSTTHVIGIKDELEDDSISSKSPSSSDDSLSDDKDNNNVKEDDNDANYNNDNDKDNNDVKEHEHTHEGTPPVEQLDPFASDHAHDQTTPPGDSSSLSSSSDAPPSLPPSSSSSDSPTDTPTDAPTDTPTDAPTDTPTDTPPSSSSSDTPTDPPTNTPENKDPYHSSDPLSSSSSVHLPPNAKVDPNMTDPNLPFDSVPTSTPTPSPSPSSESSSSASESSLIPSTSSSSKKLGLEDLPYSDQFNDMVDGDEHTHSESDEEDSTVQSTSLPENDTSSQSPPTESSPVTIPDSSVVVTRPSTVDPLVQLEKEKKKQRENEEKEIVERKVRQEYAAEISGAKSNITNHNSTSLELPKPLLFIHVPKTAGSTLAQVFKTNSPTGKYKHFWSHPRVDELQVVPEQQVMFGHFRYGLHFYLPNQTASYATMLREPIERVISYYHFHLQDPKDPAHKFAKEHTFEEWLDLSPAAHNEMTKCLSGIRSEFEPSVESFAMAKHHLKQMGYVGLTERFDESLKLMKYYFGFKDLGYSQTKVGVKKPPNIDASIREKIKEKNLMDIELYKIAQEMFENQMADLSKHLLQQEMNAKL